MKRLLAFLLIPAILLSLTVFAFASYPVTVSGVPDSELIGALVDYFKIKEGSYDTVVRNDCGAVSIGILQWHGPRALSLVRKIIGLLPKTDNVPCVDGVPVPDILGRDFYNEITVIGVTNWNDRILTADEAASLKTVLKTEESKNAQDEQAVLDVSSYLSLGRERGLKTAGQLFYHADLCNQYGNGGAKTMLTYAVETAGYSAIADFPNLCEIHLALIHTDYQSVQNYIERRRSTYDFITKTLQWETVGYYVAYAPEGGNGSVPEKQLLYFGDAFTVAGEIFEKPGYAFKGWQARRDSDGARFVKGTGWCSEGWIAKQGYTVHVFQPGDRLTMDKAFSSTGDPFGTYSFVPVWQWDGSNLPAESGGCVHDWRLKGQSAAGCTDAGYVSYFCTKCGKSGWDSEALPLGHSYGNWSVETQPSCAAEGMRSRKCARCGVVQTERLPALAHVPSQTVTDTAPSCTAQGSAHTECTLCGAILTRSVLPPSGHTPGERTVTVQPSCTAQGRAELRCAVCGEPVSSELLPALNHSWGEWETVTETTEVSDGVQVRYCASCGRADIRIAPCGTHAHNYRKTVVAPTCTSSGYDLYSCFCGKSYTENETPASGHSVAPDFCTATCTQPGSATGKCSRCMMTVTTSVDAFGHSWDGGAVTLSPTAFRAGTRTFTCTRCGAGREETLPRYSVCPGGSACISCAFADIPDSPDWWAHKAVDYCVEQGLLSGTSASTFDPSSRMTRAMLVSVLYRMEGCPSVSGTNRFPDVPGGMWYTDAVLWASEKKIVAGTDTGAFLPDSPVSREQLAVFLFRYTVYKAGSCDGQAELTSFADAGAVSDFALVAVKWAVSAGIISGVPADGALQVKPQNSATRAEVASILMRYLLR